jgi:hypothetical protein
MKNKNWGQLISPYCIIKVWIQPSSTCIWICPTSIPSEWDNPSFLYSIFSFPTLRHFVAFDQHKLLPAFLAPALYYPTIHSNPPYKFSRVTLNSLCTKNGRFAAATCMSNLKFRECHIPTLWRSTHSLKHCSYSLWRWHRLFSLG